MLHFKFGFCNLFLAGSLAPDRANGLAATYLDQRGGFGFAQVAVRDAEVPPFRKEHFHMELTEMKMPHVRRFIPIVVLYVLMDRRMNDFPGQFGFFSIDL